jgi:DNA-binding XRE family transcriptional regulator
MKTRLTHVNEHLKEMLKDPYFKELYELDSIKTEIALKIVGYRAKHGLTQGQLAKKVGVSQQQISLVEEGNFSSFQTIQKILLAIGYKIKRIQLCPLTRKEQSIIKSHKTNV